MATTLSAVTLNSTDPDRTAAFWAGLLGGEPSPGGNGYVHVQGGPVLLIVQPVARRAESAGTDVHLDLRADDPAASVRHALALGAVVVASRSDSHGAWTVLRDPDGREFCVA